MVDSTIAHNHRTHITYLPNFYASAVSSFTSKRQQSSPFPIDDILWERDQTIRDVHFYNTFFRTTIYVCRYVCAVFSRIHNTVFQNRNKVLKEIFLLINYGGRGFEYKVELCPDFIHRLFTFYTGRTLYTKSYTTGFGQGLEITSGFKARNRFI